VELQPGASISYTFDEAGVHPYACALHPGMSGAIVVGDLDQALAAGSTGATDAAQADATTSSTSTTLALVALGIGAGLLVGAAAVWRMTRRRAPDDRSLVHAE